MLSKILALAIVLASASGQLTATSSESDTCSAPAATAQSADDAAPAAAETAAAPAAGSATDLMLEVVVSGEGDKAVFRLAEGATTVETADAVVAFCSAHVGENDLEQCTAALSQAVEGSWAKKAAAAAQREAWKDPASVFNFVPPPGSEELLKAAGSGTPGVTNLEVAVNAEGGAQVFSHVAGADPFSEASAFCAQHVSAASPAACEAQLVAALEKRLTDFKAFQAQKDAAATNGDSSSAVAGGARPTVAQQLGTLLPPGSAAAVPAEELLPKGVSVVALYFAADWCGPCRQFTPALKKYHHMVKDFKKKGFEVVWVSGSKNQQGFDSYFQEMPWPALPLASQAQNNALRAKYKVQGFPTLVFVDATTGEVLVKDGRQQVAQDPNGDGFPYATPIQLAGKFAKALWTTLVPPSVRSAIATHPVVAKARQLLPAR